MKYSKLLFTFILLSALSKILNAGDFPFVTNIHINEAAINRFLAKQYNDAGFIKSWSGTFNGNAYSLSIERPVVVLQSNSIVIEIGVTLNNNYYLLRLELQPFCIVKVKPRVVYFVVQEKFAFPMAFYIPMPSVSFADYTIFQSNQISPFLPVIWFGTFSDKSVPV